MTYSETQNLGDKPAAAVLLNLAAPAPATVVVGWAASARGVVVGWVAIYVCRGWLSLCVALRPARGTYVPTYRA